MLLSFGVRRRKHLNLKEIPLSTRVTVTHVRAVPAICQNLLTFNRNLKILTLGYTVKQAQTQGKKLCPFSCVCVCARSCLASRIFQSGVNILTFVFAFASQV